jgi:hypothetical protein
MAHVLDDNDLVAWLEQRFGTRLAVENGRLRAEGAASVPATVRAVGKARQGRLVELLKATSGTALDCPLDALR